MYTHSAHMYVHLHEYVLGVVIHEGEDRRERERKREIGVVSQCDIS